MKRILASFVAVTVFALAVFAGVGAGHTQAEGWVWSGGLHVLNKTDGTNLSTSSTTAYANVGTNVVFTPEGMGPNADHFTVIMKDMSNNQTVYYQTSKSLWSMQHPTQDGSLGWTAFKTGQYWLQVNAYQANGVGAGSYQSVLMVQ